MTMQRLRSFVGWMPEEFHSGDILQPSKSLCTSRSKATTILMTYRILFAALMTYNAVYYWNVYGGIAQYLYLSHYKTLMLLMFLYTTIAAMAIERFGVCKPCSAFSTWRMGRVYSPMNGNLNMMLWAWQGGLIALVGFTAVAGQSIVWVGGSMDTTNKIKLFNFFLCHGIDWILLIGDVLLSSMFIDMRHHIFGVIMYLIFSAYYIPMMFCLGIDSYPQFVGLSQKAGSALMYPSVSMVLMFPVYLTTVRRRLTRLGKFL